MMQRASEVATSGASGKETGSEETESENTESEETESEETESEETESEDTESVETESDQIDLTGLVRKDHNPSDALRLVKTILPPSPPPLSSPPGLVTLELYKVLQGFKADRLRNTFANLALPLFSMAEPVPPKRVEFRGDSWSAWDRWVIEGDITVQELLDWFQAKKLDAYR